MTARDDLARLAVNEAMRIRARNGKPPHEPLCPVDLALAEGVDVRFEAIPSLEGIYSPDGPTIVLGSLRPPGRRSYNCAHELGHHAFGHGLRIDELLDGVVHGRVRNDAEYLADRFAAAALLMPKLAVMRAFTERGWSPADCDAEQIFVVAGVLGVGYTTLVGYLQGTLGVLPAASAERLRRVSPREIRAAVVGAAVDGLVVVDGFWNGRPIDAEVGDIIAVPPNTLADGDVVAFAGDGRLLARSPGRARLRRGTWQADIRVSRSKYAGLAAYRHIEEADDDA